MDFVSLGFGRHITECMDYPHSAQSAVACFNMVRYHVFKVVASLLGACLHPMWFA